MELVFEFNPMGKVFTGIGDAPNPAVFTILKHRHTWDNGSITKKPTQLEEGEKTFTCMTCSYTKAEIIPKLPEKETPSSEDKKPGGEKQSNEKRPETGDNSPIFPYVLFAAGTVTLIAVIKKRKKG